MTTLLAYSTALFIASWIGGWLPRRYALTHVQTQLVMSLVAGLMLGVASLHLIPHSVELGQSIDHTMYFVVGGLVFMLLLLRLFHFHQHDIATGGEDCASPGVFPRRSSCLVRPEWLRGVTCHDFS